MFSNRRWSKQKSVLTIAAVGDLWTYTVVSREDHPSQLADADELDPDWEPRVDLFEALEWREPAAFGRAGDSTSHLEEVKKWLANYVDSEQSQQ